MPTVIREFEGASYVLCCQLYTLPSDTTDLHTYSTNSCLPPSPKTGSHRVVAGSMRSKGQKDAPPTSQEITTKPNNLLQYIGGGIPLSWTANPAVFSLCLPFFLSKLRPVRPSILLSSPWTYPLPPQPPPNKHLTWCRRILYICNVKC